MKPFVLSKLILAIICFRTAFAVNFQQCLAKINNMTIDGKVDNHGNALPASSTNATAITYKLCTSVCGSTEEAFEWTVFSQEFSAWSLPWLALISQLPFGANDKLDNLESVILTVGSPALAAYSLALTVLNGRWVARLFGNIRYPNTRNAVKILNHLQQAPLRIRTEKSKLASLVVLPQNDEWWKELVTWLDYSPKWSISATASVAWVIIAYVFTLVDYFSQNVLENHPPNISGQGVGAIGALWLWLLPIVVGWMQISPTSDSRRLIQAVDRANSIAYIATENSPPSIAHTVNESCAITLQLIESDSARRDEHSTPPIFNYARHLSWTESVMLISEAFHCASERVQNQERNGQAGGDRPCIRPRDITRIEAEVSCMPTPGKRWRLPSNSSILSRMTIASIFAITLQWGTTGAAVIIMWYSPTIGLGCRSGAFIAYGVLSTIVWLMLLSSSLMAHYSVPTSKKVGHSSHSSFAIARRVGRRVSIFLRCCGKIIAAINSVWIVSIGILQFANVFNNCYCDSCAISLGSKAYNVLLLTTTDANKMRVAWIFGFALSAAAVTFFSGFVTIFVNPTLPKD